MAPVDLTFDDAEDGYAVPLFENTWAIDQMYNVPRFGHPKDVSVIYDGTEDEQMDYYLGLMGVGIIILGVFLIWSLVIVTLKICGYNCCRGDKMSPCASGRPRKAGSPPRMPFIVQETMTLSASKSVGSAAGDMELPNNPDIVKKETNDYKEEVKAYKEEVAEIRLQMYKTRTVFLVCGFLVLASVGFFLYFGATSLKSVIDQSAESIDTLDTIVAQSINTTGTFLSNEQDAQDAQTDLIETNANWCPDSDNPDLLTLKSSLSDLIDSVNALSDGDFVYDMTNVHEGLIVQKPDIASTKDDMQYEEYGFIVALTLASLLAFVTVILMVGAIKAGRDNTNPRFICWQSYFILPVFCFMMFLCILFTVIFVLGTTASSDFCKDGPDENVMKLIGSYSERFDGMILDYMNYYVNGCSGDQPLDFSSYGAKLTTAMTASHSFTTALDSVNIEQLARVCGAETSLVVAIAALLHGELHLMSESLVGSRESFFCSQYNGVYTHAYYDTYCYDTIETFYYLYFCLIGMSFFGMLMICYRLSWQESVTDVMLDKNFAADLGTVATMSVNGGSKYSPKSASGMSASSKMVNGKSYTPVKKGGYYGYKGMPDDDNIEMTTNFGPDDKPMKNGKGKK